MIEFYVTSPNGEYLYCVNDADYILGVIAEN